MKLTSEIFKYLGFFSEPELHQEILALCQLRTFEKGDVIVSQGQFVKILPIVITGGLRVYQTKEEQRFCCTMSSPRKHA